MRCPFCGSKMIYPDISHKQFSAGKAVAGAVAFGLVGATAGFIGKDTKGYRCSACGAFNEKAMDIFTESSINRAVTYAENGDFSTYNEFRKQYPNIETIFQNKSNIIYENSVDYDDLDNYNETFAFVENEESSIKNSFSPKIFISDCPIYIKTIIIKSTKNNDMLSLLAWNISEKTLRSVYLKIRVLDDVGDEISTCTCAYQGLTISPGEQLPIDKEFDLNTDLAYKVQFEIEKAAFDDNSVWRNDESAKKFELSNQIEILPENFSKYKFLREIVESQSNITRDDKIFQPVFEEEYTQCICGFLMKKNHSCSQCGMNEETLMDALSYEKLLEYQNKTIKDLALKRSKETENLFKSAQKAEENESLIKKYLNEIKEYISKTNEDVKSQKEQLQSTVKEEIDHLKSQVVSHENNLSKLNFFDFKTKKHEREQILYIQSQISKLSAPDYLLEKFAEIDKSAGESIEKNNKKIKRILKEKYGYILSKQDTNPITKNCKKYDVVCLGNYEQKKKGKYSFEKEPIEWCVLETCDSKALLISKCALDCLPFHHSRTSITWETCSLREWLNKDFYDCAFSNEEKAQITNTSLIVCQNPLFPEINQGGNTVDKIFLLSTREAEKYLTKKNVACGITDYAKSKYDDYYNVPYVEMIDGKTSRAKGVYWLRTSAFDCSASTMVFGYKTLNDTIENPGGNVNSSKLVRPAMWIDLTKL